MIVASKIWAIVSVINLNLMQSYTKKSEKQTLNHILCTNNVKRHTFYVRIM